MARAIPLFPATSLGNVTCAIAAYIGLVPTTLNLSQPSKDISVMLYIVLSTDYNIPHDRDIYISEDLRNGSKFKVVGTSPVSAAHEQREVGDDDYAQVQQAGHVLNYLCKPLFLVY